MFHIQTRKLTSNLYPLCAYLFIFPVELGKSDFRFVIKCTTLCHQNWFDFGQFNTSRDKKLPRKWQLSVVELQTSKFKYLWTQLSVQFFPVKSHFRLWKREISSLFVLVSVEEVHATRSKGSKVAVYYEHTFCHFQPFLQTVRDCSDWLQNEKPWEFVFP